MSAATLHWKLPSRLVFTCLKQWTYWKLVCSIALTVALIWFLAAFHDDPDVRSAGKIALVMGALILAQGTIFPLRLLARFNGWNVILGRRAILVRHYQHGRRRIDYPSIRSFRLQPYDLWPKLSALVLMVADHEGREREEKIVISPRVAIADVKCVLHARGLHESTTSLPRRNRVTRKHPAWCRLLKSPSCHSIGG